MNHCRPLLKVSGSLVSEEDALGVWKMSPVVSDSMSVISKPDWKPQSDVSASRPKRQVKRKMILDL